ncbi:hypothetical protein VIGAN_01269300 [Vigna angularis var. angularis]|uniref:Uncharacterized protein n=1 Tax=Vigna angularis var. angularis TaxID=157739 RepID=A0A0S3R2Z3_PHAAN|nr:hypothetical protein VIGAN_01269300 [Vigna angularis var. angularis]
MDFIHDGELVWKISKGRFSEDLNRKYFHQLIWRICSRHQQRFRGKGLSGQHIRRCWSEGGVWILHQNLTSANSAPQGLLRKLGAGLDDLLPSSAMVICGREERFV